MIFPLGAHNLIAFLKIFKNTLNNLIMDLIKVQLHIEVFILFIMLITFYNHIKCRVGDMANI